MKIYLLLLSLLSLAYSCKKDKNKEPELPPATQEGKSAFACKFDDKVWISLRGYPRVGANLYTDTFGVEGIMFSVGGSLKLENGGIEELGIVIWGGFKLQPQIYSLNDTSSAYAVYHRVGSRECFASGNSGYGRSVTRNVTGGVLQITKIDTATRIVSGTFSFDVPTDYCGTYKIRDGRFDLKYQ